ncbi:MAG: 3-hydroxyacyl-CoA dehydrogenase NAD-binding domain-containing protein [Albidovulum sp.]|nr:3-hydroxyacyl-CoA dehydrogenase NAD-binding domain-containing protein [Albidovulum sp.]
MSARKPSLFCGLRLQVVDADSNEDDMIKDVNKIAVLGAGLIGSSWAALFLASGRSVSVFDPAGKAEEAVRNFVESALLDIERLGFAKLKNSDALEFCKSAAEAVKGANFVQESVPEDLATKIGVYREIESCIEDDAVVATSSSGLTLTELQRGWRDPSRLVLGHPFNPPHLIPLVEVMGNDRTSASSVELAQKFYESVGKVTIRLRKEVPGHVANRLQAAVWREAIHLAKEGVASVEDIDKAVAFGPGIRWAVMGPSTLFHLAAGEGGIAEFCQRYASSFHRWWEDLGDAKLDQDTRRMLLNGVGKANDGNEIEHLAMERDAKLLAILDAIAKFNK